MRCLAHVSLTFAALWVLTNPVVLHAREEVPDHWFVDSLVKVFPDDQAKEHSSRQLRLVAARNSHPTLQLALRAHQRVDGVTAGVEGWDKAAARSIGVQIRLVGYVVVAKNTTDTPESELLRSAPALFPDVLLEKFPVTLEPDKTQSLWITLSIPSNLKPDDYRGEVVVRSSEKEILRAPFTVRVLSATVPAEQTLRVTNWFYLSDRQLRQFYDVKVLTEPWWSLLEAFGRVLAEHHQNMIVTPLSGFYFSKLALVQARPRPAGLDYDFSNFDRWVRTFQKAGVIGYIEGSHVLRRKEDSEAGGPLKVDVYVLDNGRAVLQSLEPDDPRAERALSEMLSAFHRHLKERGWTDIYYQHVLDEVDDRELSIYMKYAALVHRSMPGVRTMDAVQARGNLDIYEKSCDTWVPVLGSFDDIVPRLRRHQQSGGEVWFYTCLTPRGGYANRFIDFSLLKARLLQWVNFRYGLTGFLHWGGNYWSLDPIHDTAPPLGSDSGSVLPPGDAFVAYPDPERKGLLSSIRLEAMREGIEDYELLQQLQSKKPQTAQDIASRMIRSFTEYVRDPAEFRQLQLELLQQLAP